MSGNLIYDTGLLYGQHMNEGAQAKLARFYEELLAGFDIKTIHDCSIGAGGATLPLAVMGYTVSGSDLSRNLLDRAQLNFDNKGFSPHLFIADFREFSNSLDSKIDCVISTGNSLPHVNLDGFNSFLRSAAEGLADKGFLYFDIRNWDAIVTEKPNIHVLVSRMMASGEHRSVFQLYNWHDDGSVTFSFATCIDINGDVSLDVVECPVYYPLLRDDLSRSLADNGFKLLKLVDVDHLMFGENRIKEKRGEFDADFDNIQWYGVLAQKNI